MWQAPAESVLETALAKTEKAMKDYVLARPECMCGVRLGGPHDYYKIAPGVCGCGNSDGDADGDGYIDCVEFCPNDLNKILPGLCGCGVADVDTDADGVPSRKKEGHTTSGKISQSHVFWVSNSSPPVRRARV